MARSISVLLVEDDAQEAERLIAALPELRVTWVTGLAGFDATTDVVVVDHDMPLSKSPACSPTSAPRGWPRR